jgi:plastocyanin domain-containing protein
MGMISGVIKVVDKLETVDTSKPDSSLPPPSTGPSCCARPIDDSQAQRKSSIYGNDLSKVPTEELIGRASSNNSFTFKGIGYELKPLIAVASTKDTTRLKFDLSEFDNTDEKINIIDGTNGKIAASFKGKAGINEIELNSTKAGIYAIVRGNEVLGLIETVDEVNKVDLEVLRKNYIQQ